MLRESAGSNKKRKRVSLAEKTRNRTLDQMLSEATQDMMTDYGVSYHDIVSPPPPPNVFFFCPVKKQIFYIRVNTRTPYIL